MAAIRLIVMVEAHRSLNTCLIVAGADVLHSIQVADHRGSLISAWTLLSDSLPSVAHAALTLLMPLETLKDPQHSALPNALLSSTDPARGPRKPVSSQLRQIQSPPSGSWGNAPMTASRKGSRTGCTHKPSSH